MRWHQLEFYGFLHFGINTFTDKEWGYGDDDPGLFNPTAFDANQIAQVARQAGMRGLILTAKHHDGFCLWPSRYTEYSVKNSPWRGGKGDVVRELADACHRHGLLFGVYLSPWDRNHPEYGRPEYISYYRNQLVELLTGYGEIFIVWFDGANGGDGFYGGARQTRRIDRLTYYDWPNTWKIVRDLMPMAVMFSDVGPDVRWVGNEAGMAGEPCWSTLTAQGAPGSTTADLNHGDRHGTQWLPPECDVSIRPGWFYHPSQDGQVKTPRQLFEIYLSSVGRGACLNLNVPPDRTGRIHPNDQRSLLEFRKILDQTFKRNIAAEARLYASQIRGGQRLFGPENLFDSDISTYWCTDDNVTSAQIILDFDQPVTFDILEIREYVLLGQRIDAFAADAWIAEDWKTLATGTSIGNRRLLRFAPTTTKRFRLRIISAAACPVVTELGLYASPYVDDR
jgi:alpha-L-fucosidase